MSTFTHTGSAVALLLGILTILLGSAPQQGRAAPIPEPIHPDLAEPHADGRSACQFAIRADNNIGEDVWILYSESSVYIQQVNVHATDFRGKQNQRLAPGEKLNTRFEAPGSCGVERSWFIYVRIGPRGGEVIQVGRNTEGRTNRTVHLGEAACWATAPLRGVPDSDRYVKSEDDAIGCDPEDTRYGLAPAREEGPVADARTGVKAGNDPAASLGLPADVSLGGNWVRRDSNNPRNNGMRINVQGDRATLTGMPSTGSRRFRTGQVLWQDLTNDGTVRVRGSDGAYYLARVKMEGPDRLHIDIDHNGPGNDQTWVRAGPSIDGDWVLVEATDGENEGIRVRVDGSQATARFVPSTASRSFRVGARAWQDIGGGDQPQLGKLEALSDGREYATAQFRLLDENRLRMVFDAGGTVQLWARPGVAEKLQAARERGESLTEVPQPREPVDDPLAEGSEPDLSEEERTLETGEGETAATMYGDRRIPLRFADADDPQLAGASLSGPDSERRPEVPDPVTALEQQPATVVGRVFRDDDRDGVFDEEDSGIAGVALDVVAENTGVRSRLQTSADGRFRLEVVGGVNHRISVDRTTLPFRGELTTFHTELHYTVPPGNTSENAAFGFHEIEPAVIRGTVWEERDEYRQDGFGVRDADEPGIEGVRIVAKSSGTQESSSVLTDEEGRYVLEVSGDVATTISADTATLPFFGHPSSEQSDYHVVVPEGRSAPALDFGFRRLQWTLEVAVARLVKVDEDEIEGFGQSTTYECHGVGGIPVYLVDSVSGDTITLVTSEDEFVSIESYGPLRHRVSVEESALPFEATLSEVFGANWYGGPDGTPARQIGSSDDPEYEILGEHPRHYGTWVFQLCYDRK